MQFKLKVQFLGCKVNDSNLYCYDFLDLDSNLPFTVYSPGVVESFSKYEIYHNYDGNFSLVLSKTKDGIKWKIKGV